jgi:hypothetical protein
MLGLDAQSLPRVQTPETAFQLLYDVVVHTELPLQVAYRSLTTEAGAS